MLEENGAVASNGQAAEPRLVVAAARASAERAKELGLGKSSVKVHRRGDVDIVACSTFLL